MACGGGHRGSGHHQPVSALLLGQPVPPRDPCGGVFLLDRKYATASLLSVLDQL